MPNTVETGTGGRPHQGLGSLAVVLHATGLLPGLPDLSPNTAIKREEMREITTFCEQTSAR